MEKERPKHEPMSALEKAVLRTWVKLLCQSGKPASNAEVARSLGLSAKEVAKIKQSLVKKGYIKIGE